MLELSLSRGWLKCSGPNGLWWKMTRQNSNKSRWFPVELELSWGFLLFVLFLWEILLIYLNWTHIWSFFNPSKWGISVLSRFFQTQDKYRTYFSKGIWFFMRGPMRDVCVWGDPVHRGGPTPPQCWHSGSHCSMHLDLWRHKNPSISRFSRVFHDILNRDFNWEENNIIGTFQLVHFGKKKLLDQETLTRKPIMISENKLFNSNVTQFNCVTIWYGQLAVL